MKEKVIKLIEDEQTLEITEDVVLKALYVGRGSTSLKTKLNIIHRLPGLQSRVHIKAVVFDSARFDFEGVLRIDRGATGCDTYLKVDCLVVGENACARAVPSLEIQESEVKGGHGATIGYLDEMMIHYLNARGIGRNECEKLLVDAFIQS